MAAQTSYESAPPAYPSDGSAPLLAQGGYPPQPGYPPQQGQPMYPQVAQGQYQPVPTDKQAYAYPGQQTVAYQPTTMGQMGQPMPPGTVVFVQANATPDPNLHKIKDLLGLSIFTTICCNLLFGVIAIVFSIRVRDAKRHNNIHEAKSAYKIMLAMNITGIVLSAVLIIVVVILYVTGFMIATSAINSYYG